MMIEIFIILLIIHIICDFYFQTDENISNKLYLDSKTYKVNYVEILKHVAIYIIFSSVIFLLFKSNIKINYLFIVLLFSFHLIVDLCKSVISAGILNVNEGKINRIKIVGKLLDSRKKLHKKHNKKFDSVLYFERVSSFVFVFDQLLHVSSLLLISWIIDTTFKEYSYFMNFDILNIYVLKLILAFLLIGKMFNIVFKEFFSYYKPSPEAEKCIKCESKIMKDKGDEKINGGAIVGTMERYLIMICLITNNFPTIGFILTAKSVARFKKLDNKNFADYFLIGTLSSLLGTIAIFYILNL